MLFGAHLNPLKSRPRNLYDLVIFTGEGDFVDVNPNASAEYGIAVGQRDCELAATIRRKELV
jgi:hypothetical protein